MMVRPSTSSTTSLSSSYYYSWESMKPQCLLVICFASLVIIAFNLRSPSRVDFSPELSLLRSAVESSAIAWNGGGIGGEGSDGSSPPDAPLQDSENSNNNKNMLLNPLFSLDPIQHSLHPKWKLWSQFETDQEKREALDTVGAYLTKYGKKIMPNMDRKYQNVRQGTCEFDKVIGSSGHTLCGPAPPQPCTFISFGINDDPSWDREVASTWGCRGFAGDPTVHHPSKLHENVTFHNIGASMLMANEERTINKGGTSDWWTTSMPKLRYFLGVDRIAILKLDCEGCEMALSRDMLREDPTFLHHVDQISIETHVTKQWLSSQEHVYYFGLMFALLEEAGFVMEWSSVFGCSKRHEIHGCMPELEKYGWPCGYKPWPGRDNVVLGRSCQEFTWKRYELQK